MQINNSQWQARQAAAERIAKTYNVGDAVIAQARYAVVVAIYTDVVVVRFTDGSCARVREDEVRPHTNSDRLDAMSL